MTKEIIRLPSAASASEAKEGANLFYPWLKFSICVYSRLFAVKF
jgi:hypothetical protein